MSFLVKNEMEFEVPISGFTTQYFYAQINARTRDASVISGAVNIVNKEYPQKFGPHSMTYCSFANREHFLNLLLRFYDDKNILPGQVEIQELKKICSKRYNFQRDAILIGKKKYITKKSTSNGTKIWYLIFLIVILSQAIHKHASKFYI